MQDLHKLIFFLSQLFTGVLLQETNFTELKFTQTDYKIEFERMELASFSKPYVEDFKVVTRKYNRTCPVVNMTITTGIDIDYESQIVTQAYVFLSNEYRYFPARFQVNFCHALEKNYIGLRGYFNCGNFKGCPMRKGTYHVCNWTPDASQFPPLIPNGRYMLEFQALYRNVELFVLHFYGRVYRPISIPK